ncbi:MAG: hypothetical protein AAF539_05430 [Planctomycetota bacterium]
MWRSLFMAVGIMVILVGAESLLIDEAVVYAAGESTAVDFMDPAMQPAQVTKTWSPSERFPWAMLAGGAVIVLYAVTLPKRWHRAA